MPNISIDQISQVINKELTLYSNEIINGVKQVAKEESTKLVKKTKDTAPVGERNKHYKDQIASRKLTETDKAITYLWYVKGSDYRLSHLLENGHANRDGSRTNGTHFIANAYSVIEEEYIQKVEEVIKNG